LKNTCGLTDIDFIPINGFEGINVKNRVDKAVCDWYDGPSLLEKLNEIPIPIRYNDKGIRIPIIDKIKVEGGTYCYGKVEAGVIKEDMWVYMLPYRIPFQIINILNSKDQKIYYAAAGENVKIRVKGLEDDDIERGYMICSTDDFCHIANEILCRITVTELPEHKPIISEGYSCIIHLHAFVHEIEISHVEAVINSDKKKIKASFLKNNQEGIVKILCKKYMCIEKFAEFPSLGRFTLRDEGRTMGFGEILKVKPAFK